MNSNEWKNIFSNIKAEYLIQFKQFLAFKSISTDPENDVDCRNCAVWLADYLKNIGFKVELIETGTKPLVFAEYYPAGAKKTALYYGHYDVQPVDPIDLWKSDPFEPTERNGRIYARGAQDNKGQTFYFIKALETLIKNNQLKVGLKILIEGEEESGSEGISKVLPQIADRIKADCLLVCDTGTHNIDIGSIIMGLRGILYLNLKLSGAKQDLHSGVHGGLAPNPIHELAKLVAALHDQDGAIAIPGYYDEVEDPTIEELKYLNHSTFSAQFYEKEVGLPPLGGERDLPPAIKRGFRPTIEVNGFHSGYTGPGTKTVIPNEAQCFMTGRLVSKQNGERCLELIKNYLNERAPVGLKFEITKSGVGGLGCKFDLNAPVVAKGIKVVKEIFNCEPEIIWEGASIPIVASLTDYVTEGALLVGFGLEEDAIHAPNESFSLQQIELGFIYAGMLLSELGND